MTPFGRKIRRMRAERGLSLKEMAQALNLSSAYLSALEHGRRGRPSPGLVMQIIGYFNIIWDEAEEMKALAKLSRPKATLDTSGLSPAATELANRLEQSIRSLPDETLDRMLCLLKERSR